MAAKIRELDQNQGVDQNLMLMLEGGEVDEQYIMASNQVEIKKKNKKLTRQTSKKFSSNKLGDASHKSLKRPLKSESSSKHEDTMKSEFPSKNEGERNYKLL